MDPLSTGSSAIAVLQASAKVVQYIISASGATKDRRRLQEEVVACESILLQIQERIEDDDGAVWEDKVKTLEGHSTPLHRLDIVLGVLKTKLEPKTGLDKALSLLKWPFEEKEVDGMLASIQREKSLLQLALTCSNTELVREVKKNSEKNQELLVNVIRMIQDQSVRDETQHAEVTAALANIKLSQDHVKDDLMEMKQRQMESDRHQILDWITPVDYASQQIDFFRRRQEGTGQWLLNSPEFQTWVHHNKHTLFCHGIPGAGKTILTSIVVDELTTRFDKNSSVGLAYVYCDFRRQDRQKVEDLIASLLKQLCQARYPIPEIARKMYKPNEPKRAPPYNDLYEALQKVVATFSKVYIIIDALDECQDTSRHRSKFLDAIFALQKEHPINIFATSRNNPDITELFQSGTSMDIRASQGDVRRYVEARMPELPKFVRERPDLQQDIITTIIPAVDGMFLLVKLHIDSLIGKTTLKALIRALSVLSSMPSGTKAYDEAYNDAMHRIQHQESDYQQLAKQVLAWITCANRPLSRLELQHALAVEVGESSIDEDNIPHIDLMLSVCAGLVTVDEESDIIRLVHYTTQEFFERTQSNWFPGAEQDITDVCLTYLSFDVFENGICMTCELLLQVLDTFPFYDYAARYWGYHARKLLAMPESATDFLNDRNKLDLAVQVMLSEANSRLPDDFPHFPLEWTPLHLAAYFGIEKLTENHKPHDLDFQDSFRSTPLSVAANCGNEIIVKLLLEKGADIDAADQHGKTPLIFAALNGHEAIVELLIDTGANLEAKDDVLGQTAMLWAALRGQSRIVELLLATGADADPVGDDGRTPLFLAAKYGHLDIMELLLDTEAVNMNPMDKYGATLLHVAAQGGHIDIVELLLRMGGILIASKDNLGRTPLFRASQYSRASVVEALLRTGKADVNSSDDSGRTPLFVAGVEEANDEIVQLLLAAKDIDVNKKDKLGDTPLSKAVKCKQTSVVKQLLTASEIDPNSRDVFDRTPVLHAALEGREEMVELLMSDDRVQLEATDRWWSTPLSMAARKGHLDTAKLLLTSQSVDIDSQDIGGRTPLWWATKTQNSKMVDFLTETAAVREIKLSSKGFPVRPRNMAYHEEGVASKWFCDACALMIPGGTSFYHCGVCNDNDFDICSDCFSIGARCLDNSHRMTERHTESKTFPPRKTYETYDSDSASGVHTPTSDV